MSIFTMIEKRIENQIDELQKNDDAFTNKSTDAKSGIGFMFYTLEKVFKHMDYDDLEEGIVDSSYRNESHDYGLDAVYLTANNEKITSPDELDRFNQDTKFIFHLFQFKKGRGIDQATLLKLKEGLKECFIESNVSDEMNAYMHNTMSNLYELREIIYEKFNSNQIQINIYVCFSGVKENVRENPLLMNQISDIEKLLKDNAYKNVETHIVDAQDLIDLEREQEEIVEVVSYNKTFKYITATDEKEKLNGYICVINAVEIAKLVKKWQTQLFEANIRDYQNNKGNNSKIFETCTDKVEGKYFWSFNNGLTITCNKVEELPHDKYRIHGLQIVNGCQTSNTLYKALINSERVEFLNKKDILTTEEEIELNDLKNSTLNEEATVLVKIIETGNPDLIYKITETTNSQTPIKLFSLKANEDIHKNIEQYFADYEIFYERRANFYRNQGISVQKIIDIKKLAQLYYSMIMFKPSQARAHPKKIFVTYYDDIFPDPNVKQNNYKLYLVPVLVHLKVEKLSRSLLRKKEKIDGYNKVLLGNGKFHISCFLLSSILKKNYNEKGIINKFDEIIKVLNSEDEFSNHFMTALENFKRLMQNNYGQKKESIPSTLRKADLDNRIIKFIKQIK